ncbi:transposase, partial [Nonomuraea sp. NPDC048892]|uniref:transposase n=1 Tax=Nonomuraea sp. NPDC048892 TaxID=3154624 RepID=UPI0034033F83
RLRAKAKRRAVDWQHQTTTELAGTFAVIKVEKLAILNMITSAKGTIQAPGRNVAQKAGLNRSISGQAWGRTVTLLEYKSADRGGQVVKVPAPGTSQTCHRCGHRDPASRNGTVFACVNPVCGWVGHADTNAAININNAAGPAVSGRGDLSLTRSAKRQPPRAAQPRRDGRILGLQAGEEVKGSRRSGPGAASRDRTAPCGSAGG